MMFSTSKSLLEVTSHAYFFDVAVSCYYPRKHFDCKHVLASALFERLYSFTHLVSRLDIGLFCLVHNSLFRSYVSSQISDSNLS